MTATRTHLCTDSRVYGPVAPGIGMVSKEEIREQNLTTDDVMDYEFAEPRTEVEWLPEWDEYPEEQPGENARIEDGVLKWKQDGFEVELESYETTHWRARVAIPKEIGEYWPREIDLKCRKSPEHGFVESVEIEDYCAVEAVLILQENFQPVWELERYVDSLIEAAEEGRRFREEVSEKMAAARENEE